MLPWQQGFKPRKDFPSHQERTCVWTHMHTHAATGERSDRFILFQSCHTFSRCARGSHLSVCVAQQLHVHVHIKGCQCVTASKWQSALSREFYLKGLQGSWLDKFCFFVVVFFISPVINSLLIERMEKLAAGTQPVICTHTQHLSDGLHTRFFCEGFGCYFDHKDMLEKLSEAAHAWLFDWMLSAVCASQGAFELFSSS